MMRRISDTNSPAVSVTGRAILREISRPPKLGRVLLGWVFFASVMARNRQSADPPRVRRNGVLEKTGAYIQAESSQTERCAQNKCTKQSDGHERIKSLGFGNGAYRDIRSSIHGNLQWKN